MSTPRTDLLIIQKHSDFNVLMVLYSVERFLGFQGCFEVVFIESYHTLLGYLLTILHLY